MMSYRIGQQGKIAMVTLHPTSKRCGQGYVPMVTIRRDGLMNGSIAGRGEPTRRLTALADAIAVANRVAAKLDTIGKVR